MADLGTDRIAPEATTLDPSLLARAVSSSIRECATNMRADFFCAIQKAYNEALKRNPGSRETSVLRDIVGNAIIGQEQGMPICQDTGSVWVCLEVGSECEVPGNIFAQVNHAVSQAYTEGHLRMSMLRDALFDRTNTNDNTPAFTEIRIVPGRGVKVHVMLKGGGSDNASRLVMLPPSAGAEGIKQEVIACVREKAANACPPLLIGVGAGATFDKVAGLAKHALLRRVGSPAESDEAAEFEQELLDAVNATDIGPGALGGFPTALAVHLETAPCHIAALPLAINMGCCAMRSATMVIVDERGHVLREPVADTWTSPAETRQN